MHTQVRVFLLSSLALVTAGSLHPVSAIAQDAESKWITLSPRIWIAQVQTPDTPSFFRESYLVPSYGASLSITPPMLKGLSILLVGLYGKGEGDGRYFSAGIFGTSISLDVKFERIDVEGLLIYQIPGAPIYVFIGSRYVRLEEHMDGSNATTSVDFEVDNEITIVKAGFGASGSLSEDGKHRLFGNASVGVGFADVKTRFRLEPAGLDIRRGGKNESPSLDVNVGYDYSFWDSFGLQLRYRVSMVFLKDFIDQEATDLTHGPEISVAKSW